MKGHGFFVPTQFSLFLLCRENLQPLRAFVAALKTVLSPWLLLGKSQFIGGLCKSKRAKWLCVGGSSGVIKEKRGELSLGLAVPQGGEGCRTSLGIAAQGGT